MIMRREWAQPIGSAAVSWRRCYCRWYAAIAAVALLFGRPIEAFSPGSSRITPGRLSAQSPCLSQYAASSCSRSRSSPALHLSLDDNWEQVAENLIAKARLINWNDLATNTVNDLRWNKVFSKEWFAAIERGVVEFAVGVTHLPVVNQVELVVLPTLFIVLASLYRLSFPDVNYRSGMEPYPRGVYDARAAQTYYSRRKRLVLQRALQLLRLSNRFLIGLAIDKYITRKEEENRPLRAKQLLALITDLGPTAIKVGQALSVRPDLIPAEYAATLSTLQDQVPPFSTTAAKQLLRQELGEERYQNLGLGKSNGSSASGSTSSKNGSGPVASASIGQVYKGQLNGMDVAIKVQRPNVLAEIALDLYIVREFAPIYQRITKSGTNLQALANEWGRGFIAELDYREEAAATMRFNDAMQARQLTAVCAPIVVPDYSTEQILVTQWVDGTRLDQSNSGDNGDDIPRLCAVALNAYLVMLLELKSLHCDPHPGNLLRTTDGRLCILDFGMTLDIDPQLQYSLLEFVAHLTSEDFEKLPDDLAALGFLKADKLDFARRSGVLEPLKYFLKQAGQGGGANGVRDRIFDEYRAKYPGLTDDELRVEMRSEMKQQMSQIVERESVATGITMEVEELQKRNRDSFQIPEWFLYSSRAFLTLEGVSLQANPKYSLIKACFPYVAKRLVADDDPRARKALRDLLYGATDSVDVDRLTDLADGFTSYTTSTKTINQQVSTNGASAASLALSRDRERRNKMVEAESTITLAKDSADIFLSPGGNLVQNLFVEESALAASAQFKDSVRDALVDGPKRFREALPFGVGTILPPLPFEENVVPFLRKSDKEVRAQQLAEKILTVVTQTGRNQNGGAGNSSPNGDSQTTADVLKSLQGLEPEQAALVLKELRENLPRYGPMVAQLSGKFVATLLNTASSNIETTLTELEQTGELPDDNVRSAWRGLATAAQRGATIVSSPSPR